eukprot:4737085-Prorocentrum_lima.AAC.1
MGIVELLANQPETAAELMTGAGVIVRAQRYMPMLAWRRGNTTGVLAPLPGAMAAPHDAQALG